MERVSNILWPASVKPLFTKFTKGRGSRHPATTITTLSGDGGSRVAREATPISASDALMGCGEKAVKNKSKFEACNML